MGQFLDHDLTLTPEPELDHESCCTGDALNAQFREKCFPIVVPDADTTFRSSSAGDSSGLLTMQIHYTHFVLNAAYTVWRHESHDHNVSAYGTQTSLQLCG